MSIVGTRPPLISETNLYEPHHKVSLLMKNALYIIMLVLRDFLKLAIMVLV